MSSSTNPYNADDYIFLKDNMQVVYDNWCEGINFYNMPILAILNGNI